MINLQTEIPLAYVVFHNHRHCKPGFGYVIGWYFGSYIHHLMIGWFMRLVNCEWFSEQYSPWNLPSYPNSRTTLAIWAGGEKIILMDKEDSLKAGDPIVTKKILPPGTLQNRSSRHQWFSFDRQPPFLSFTHRQKFVKVMLRYLTFT